MMQNLFSTSITIIGSSMLTLGLVVGGPTLAKAETIKAMDQISVERSIVIAQTGGMERRQDRRDTRQDCRDANGLVGKDKRNCKQQGRQN